MGEVVAHMDKAVEKWQEEFTTPLKFLGTMGDIPTSSAAASLLACVEGALRGFIGDNDVGERVRSVRAYEAVFGGERGERKERVGMEFLRSREVLVDGEEEGVSAAEKADEFLEKFAEELVATKGW